MKNNLVILFSIIAVLGCRGSKEVMGLYKSQPKINITGSSILLNRDSSFLYKSYLGDMFSMAVTGHWKISPGKKFLLLNSNIQTDDSLISVIENETSAIKGKIRLNVYQEDGEKYIGPVEIKAYLADGTSRNMSLNSGETYNNNWQIVKFSIFIYGTGSKVLTHAIVNYQANDFMIKLNLKNTDDYRYFKNQQWIIKAHKLFDTDTAYNKVNNTYYKVKS